MIQRLLSLMVLGTLANNPCYADMSGVLDPRTMAMGGTGVASADSSNAAFYNPALLATYDKIKEKNQDARFLFPVVSVRATNVINDLNNFQDNSYDERLSQAVTDYNNSPNAANAQNIVNIAVDLRDTVDRLIHDDYLADIYAGVVIGLPGEFEGGSFYFYRRLYGRGGANVSNADRNILNAYIEGLQFVASGGTQGQLRQDLFNGTTLIDQTGDFTSEATARALDLIEAGVAFGSEYEIFSRYFYLGFTPKFQMLKVYDIYENAGGGNTDIDHQSGNKFFMNLDFGSAYDIDNNARVGITVHNLYPHDLKSVRGARLRVRPELQGGFQYHLNRWTTAVDLDLLTNNLFGVGQAQRNLSLGTEWAASRFFAVRAGYRHNLSYASDTGPFSLGVGLNIKHALLEFAAAYGARELGASLQFGFRF